MAFRVKDLLISVVSSERYAEGCYLTLACTFRSHPYCNAFSPTGHHTTTLMWLGRAEPAAASELLAALKAQLKKALSEVEDIQKAIDRSLEPGTIEQIETLQTKLRDAMAELDRRKKEL